MSKTSHTTASCLPGALLIALFFIFAAALVNRDSVSAAKKKAVETKAVTKSD
jgi:hypothetical protein